MSHAETPTPSQAVRRGSMIISLPSVLVLGGVVYLGVRFSQLGLIGSLLAGYLAHWLYWSVTIPHWRDWVERKGLTPDDVQLLAQKVGLLWPRGSFFESTELRRSNGRRGW